MRSPSRDSSGTHRADTISCAASNQLTSASAMLEVVGDVAEDRRVVALQDAAGDLDADEETDDAAPRAGWAGGAVARWWSIRRILGSLTGSRSIRRRYQRTPSRTSSTPRCSSYEWIACALGRDHPERREAVDPLADLGEEARVGGRHHHVRRGDRVGEHLADRATRAAGTRRRRSGTPGSARRPRRPRSAPARRRSPCGRARARASTVSPTMIRTLTPASAVEAITFSAGEPDRVVTATVVRVIAADSAPAATSARVSTGAQPGGVGHQRAQRRGHVRRDPPHQLDASAPGRWPATGACPGAGSRGPAGRSAVHSTGVDACPPRPSTTRRREVTPFSVTPITAIGGSTPGTRGARRRRPRRGRTTA